MKNKNIFDCHCHFVTIEDFELYKKTSPANKFLNIRSINHKVLVKPYNFDAFKGIENMYLTEAVDLNNLDDELIRVENNLKNNNKIIGIKIYLGYQAFYANDKKIKKVTELANKYGVSMIFHCGECYASEEKINHSDAKYIEDLAKEFKDINFIASHMNWPLFENIFNLCEKYDNVFTCFSGSLDAIDKDKRKIQVDRTVDIINKYLKEYPNLKNKLMYGTDFFSEGEAFLDVSDYVKIVEMLDLNEVEKNNILYNNVFLAYKNLN